ncbi:flippase [Polaromonas glacialis]|uniref:flippase n=1 Tax=Polaromonas glacialis TaxID=866564 RepID=UPI000A061B6F|nr:flippase [Polaromonas glacialis]
MSLKRNTLWNLAGTGLPFLLGAITIPFLIKSLGIEAFGILTLVWALIGYFSLFDFGLGRALTQQVASNLARGDDKKIPHLIKSGILFTTLTGVVGGMLLYVLSAPLGNQWLKVSELLKDDTAQCLIVAAFGIPLTTITTGLRGVLEAYEDFKEVNLLRIILGIANFGLPALAVLFYGPSLTFIVLTLIFARLIVLIAHIVLVNKRLIGSWVSSKGNGKEFKNLFSFGVWMTISNIIGPLMATADRFVISSVLGAAAVAYYTVPSEILMRVLVVPAALTGALFPRLSSKLKTEPENACKLYEKCVLIVLIILTPISLVIGLGSYWGLSLWLGAEFAEQSWMVVSALSVGLLFNGIAFVPFAAIQAAGKAKTTAKLHLLEILIYVPLLYFMLHFFGLFGAAMAWVVRAGMDMILLLICAKKILKEINCQHSCENYTINNVEVINK